MCAPNVEWISCLEKLKNMTLSSEMLILSRGNAISPSGIWPQGERRKLYASHFEYTWTFQISQKEYFRIHFVKLKKEFWRLWLRPEKSHLREAASYFAVYCSRWPIQKSSATFLRECKLPSENAIFCLVFLSAAHILSKSETKSAQN